MLLRYSILCLFVLSLVDLRAQEKKDSLAYTTYYYEGGAKSSEGYLREGKPDGYWKSFYRNGVLKTEGNRKNFLLDGPWIFYDDEGNKTLEINYRDDQKSGLRKSYKNDAVVKEEKFVEDMLQGFTRIYLLTGELKKEVPYENDRENGLGYEYGEDNRVITLQTYKSGVLTKQQRINRYDEQTQKQGLWVSFYSNRNTKVEGPYVNDLKNGYWKYYQPNGNLIRVEKWIMGELQVNAQEVAKVEIKQTLNPNTGKLAFKGAFRNGKPEGVHREYDDEGNVIASKIYDKGIVLFEGIVDEEGRKQGPWKEFYPTGELKAEGSYKDNLKIKLWKYYYINGDIEQTGRYVRGQADGIWTWYYENRQVWREEEFILGEEEGPSVEYSDSGSVIAKGSYIEGLRDGEWFFVVNDHKEEGKFFEGQQIGNWKHYYLENNQLRFEGGYENGLETGLHTFYFFDGSVKRRGTYLGGEKDGIWEYYNEEKELTVTIEYESGREVKYNGERIRYGRRLDKELEKERAEEELEKTKS